MADLGLDALGRRYHHFPWGNPFKHGRHFAVVLFVDHVGVILEPGERTKLMTTVSVGHTISCSIGYLDTTGNPMLVAPTPDSPPAWTNTTPASETLVPSSDGSTAVATAAAVGTDTINLSVSVGGRTFTASLAVTVQAAPQILGSVVINTTVV